MFLPAKEQFRISKETKNALESAREDDARNHQERYNAGGARLDPPTILRAARAMRAKINRQWADFDEAAPPQFATKRHFNIETDDWMEEQIIIKMDAHPFGRGAVRECFRMKEVRMETWMISGDGHPASPSTAAASADGAEVGDLVCTTSGHAPHFQALACGLLEISRNERRTLWVAKRSMADHHRKFLHRTACQTDVIQQTLAKHYAELFNREVYRQARESGLGRCGAHFIDFLLTHVIELPDKRTFGAEAFLFGDYAKHNNNGGQTIGARTTPQAFSYFTFVKSGRRLMIVDIQGVGDLYTDPVLHFLPSHVAGALTDADSGLNFGLRGFALFLWSHRRNDIEQMLGLPAFALSPYEEKHVAPPSSATISALHTAAKTVRAMSEDASSTVTANSFQIDLSDIPGADLSDWCDWKTFHPCTSVAEPAATRGQARSASELIEAECHMEIAGMYHGGRITLRSGEPTGEPDLPEVQSAVFHIVEAARQDLPEALLALARLASGLEHRSFLPQVVSSANARPTCLALLARAASLGSPVAMGALARLVLDDDSCPRGPEELRGVALHLEAYAAAALAAAASRAEAMAAREDGEESEESEPEEDGTEQEHSCLHKCSFGWEDHRWTPRLALLRAAELWAGNTLREGEGSGQRAEELRARAAAAEQEDLRLAELGKRHG